MYSLAFKSVPNITHPFSLAYLQLTEKKHDHHTPQTPRRLASRCFSVTVRLEALGLPVLPATAGMYVWIDFRSLLPLIQQQHGSASDASDSGWAAEAMLYEALLAKPFRVCLTPGQSQHAKEPGFFRMCYAYVPDSGFEDALAKIEAFVTSLRNTRS
jgi:aspartate/methionine/tyrosine aminotransferase